MSRVLSRPMFRRGGSTGGITTGLRQGYKHGDVATGAREYVDLVESLAPSRGIGAGNEFLMNLGLNLVSNPPSGNILQTLGTEAKEPFQQFQKVKRMETSEKRDLIGQYLRGLSDEERSAIEDEIQLRITELGEDRETAARKVLDKRVHGVLKEPGEVRGETIKARADKWQESLQQGGKQLEYESLLSYLVSFCDHQSFHEHCIDSIFQNIASQNHIHHCAIQGLFTRRGGIDINPFRTTLNNKELYLNLSRQ